MFDRFDHHVISNWKKNVRFIGEVFAYCKSPQIELPNAAGFDRILEIHQFPNEPLKSIVVHVS